MKTVILCGGQGTRIREELVNVPKPLAPIGGIPIIIHLMNYYSLSGFTQFVLCLGYGHDKIIDYFSFDNQKVNIGKNMGDYQKIKYDHNGTTWEIEFLYTGLNTNTGGRVKLAQSLIKDNHFMMTYTDGLSKVNLQELIDYHIKHGKAATLTAVNPTLQYGLIHMSDDQTVEYFQEKPKLDTWINGGFMVFSKRFFSFLEINDILEKESFYRLVKAKELKAYQYTGDWFGMDTYKDFLALNSLWDANPNYWTHHLSILS